MIHIHTAAVLETMWGTPGRSPGWFSINPYNRSGRRLYWLLGHKNLLVTNACPQQVLNANCHSSPSPKWLAKNLQRLTYDLLLICGKVAQRTYERCDYVPDCQVLYIPHPAARTWNCDNLKKWQGKIQKILAEKTRCTNDH